MKKFFSVEPSENWKDNIHVEYPTFSFLVCFLDIFYFLLFTFYFYYLLVKIYDEYTRYSVTDTSEIYYTYLHSLQCSVCYIYIYIYKTKKRKAWSVLEQKGLG
ncbi:hypothetical protein V8G54_033252, partial [Vigna mungo]